MMAQKNLLLCMMDHDKCRQTFRYRHAGQNLAMVCQRPLITPEAAIEKSMNGWWMEYKAITHINHDLKYNSIRANDQYGHFTQMIQANAFAVGCAIISTQLGYCYYVACNYAVTNIVDRPIYTVGRVRSKCRTNSTRYRGLCGGNEDYYDHQRHGTRGLFVRNNSNIPPLEQWKANGNYIIPQDKIPGPMNGRQNAMNGRQNAMNGRQYPMNGRPSPMNARQNLMNVRPNRGYGNVQAPYGNMPVPAPARPPMANQRTTRAQRKRQRRMQNAAPMAPMVGTQRTRPFNDMTTPQQTQITILQNMEAQQQQIERDMLQFFNSNNFQQVSGTRPVTTHFVEHEIRIENGTQVDLLQQLSNHLSNLPF